MVIAAVRIVETINRRSGGWCLPADSLIVPAGLDEAVPLREVRRVKMLTAVRIVQAVHADGLCLRLCNGKCRRLCVAVDIVRPVPAEIIKINVTRPSPVCAACLEPQEIVLPVLLGPYREIEIGKIRNTCAAQRRRVLFIFRDRGDRDSSRNNRILIIPDVEVHVGRAHADQLSVRAVLPERVAARVLRIHVPVRHPDRAVTADLRRREIVMQVIGIRVESRCVTEALHFCRKCIDAGRLRADGNAS